MHFLICENRDGKFKSLQRPDKWYICDKRSDGHGDLGSLDPAASLFLLTVGQ